MKILRDDGKDILNNKIISFKGEENNKKSGKKREMGD